MSKFKIGERVISKESGKIGTVRAKNIIHEDKNTIIEYMVDFGGSMFGWKVFDKNGLNKTPKSGEESPLYIKEYNHNNEKLLMVAKVENCVIGVRRDEPLFFTDYDDVKGKKLSIGFSIYNGIDEYNEEIGLKYAKHRMKHKPFCHMQSKFTGEFSAETVMAIMDAKANYIFNHWENFYRPRN